MATDGSDGPKPYAKHEATTLFLRVPHPEWAAVRSGRVPEFIGSFGQTAALFNVTFPTPVVAYSFDPQRKTHDGRLMIAESFVQEPLAWCAKHPQRFGFESTKEFRRYWAHRTNRKFTPLRIVNIYRVRHVTPEDYDDMGRMLLDRLFGDWL